MAVAGDQHIQAPQVQAELRIVKLEEDSHCEQEIPFKGVAPDQGPPASALGISTIKKHQHPKRLASNSRSSVARR